MLYGGKFGQSDRAVCYFFCFWCVSIVNDNDCCVV